MVPRPDCCPAPDLVILRRLEDPPPVSRDIRRCRACGTYWHCKGEERMNFSGEDHYWEWFTRLTAEEADALE